MSAMECAEYEHRLPSRTRDAKAAGVVWGDVMSILDLNRSGCTALLATIAADERTIERGMGRAMTRMADAESEHMALARALSTNGMLREFLLARLAQLDAVEAAESSTEDKIE